MADTRSIARASRVGHRPRVNVDRSLQFVTRAFAWVGPNGCQKPVRVQVRSGLIPAMHLPPVLLLVDDHAMFRSGLRMLLAVGLPGVTLLEASSLEEALQLSSVPNLVLLDIKLQGLNGLECLPVFQRKWPQARVIMLSSMDDPKHMQLALSRGAVAFVSKADNADTIVSVIQHVLDKGHAPPEGAVSMQAPTRADDGAPPIVLTPRQAEVLNLLCQGLPSKTIGRRLNLTENTVRWHVQALLGLLNVTSRTEAVFVARRHGLID